MTKVQVSDDALADLNDGHWFYEAQEAGAWRLFYVLPPGRYRLSGGTPMIQETHLFVCEI
jgi:hypothetical protein